MAIFLPIDIRCIEFREWIKNWRLEIIYLLPPAGFVSLFLQNSVAVQTLAPPMAAAGSAGCLAVSLCEKNCKGLLRACTPCGGWQQRTVILKGPVDKGSPSKN